MQGLEKLSERLALAGIEHVVVLAKQSSEEADARSAPRRVKLFFKTSAERARDRRKAKLYRQSHKSQLKLKAKKYRMKMKHRKPNKILSDRAKLVHKKHKY
jgi:hypothetical protein